MLVQISAIAAAITQIITLGYKVASLFSEAKKRGWISDGRTLSVVISEAKNDEERAKLARLLFEHRAG